MILSGAFQLTGQTTANSSIVNKRFDAAESTLESETEGISLTSLRLNVQTRMLWVMMIVGGVVVSIVAIQDYFAGYYGRVAFYVGAYVFVLFNLAITALPYVVRAAGPLLAIFAVGAFEVYIAGTESVGNMYFLAFAIFTTVLLGPRMGAGAVVLSLGALLVLADYHNRQRPPESLLYEGWPAMHSSWIPAFLSIILLSVLSVVFIGLLLKSLQHSIQRSNAYLAELKNERNQLTAQIAETKRAEEQLRQAQRMEAVGHLAGGVAHDFNNLLQAISGYTEMMLSSLNPGERFHEELGHIQTAAQRGSSLTRQLLAFSRQQEMISGELDLNLMLENLMKMVKPIIGEHIEVQLQQQSDLASIYADASQVEQVILNLCLNARDAMPNGGTLTLRTENTILDPDALTTCSWAKPGPYVHLIVADTGEGMKIETQQRVFDPFFTTKGVGKGTGLGLATAYGIVRQHGGIIQVESAECEGAALHVYLPAFSGQTAPLTEAAPNSTVGGHETVLLAEDDDTVRKLATRVLETAGYTVHAAANGEEAVRLFHANGGNVDVLILDVVMPKMGGSEVLKAIQSDRAQIPFLFISGYAPHGAVSRVSEEQLLQKPFRSSELLQKIREVLDARVAPARR